MINKFQTVIDIGSEKVCGVQGSNGVNNSFNIKAFESENYAGFLNGEFIDIHSLKMALGSVITKLETSSQKEIDSAFLGVPAEFCLVDTQTASLNFEKTRTVNNEVINELCNLAAMKCNANKDYILVNKAPIYFACEDGRKVIDIKDVKASKLEGQICFVFVKKSFITLVSKMLKEIGIYSFQFLAAPLSQSLYLLDEEVRQSNVILIDCGYITTSVMHVYGEGLLSLKAFSLGGGNITADLAECLKLKFNEAEKLKRNIILSLELGESEVYNIETKGKTVPINAKMANEIVEKRIEDIASYITKCINSFDNINPQSVVYLTGGGLTHLKGAKDLLSKLLARNIEIAKSPSLEYREHSKSSALSVLNFALLCLESNKGGI